MINVSSTIVKDSPLFSERVFYIVVLNFNILDHLIKPTVFACGSPCKNKDNKNGRLL